MNQYGELKEQRVKMFYSFLFLKDRRKLLAEPSGSKKMKIDELSRGQDIPLSSPSALPSAPPPPPPTHGQIYSPYEDALPSSILSPPPLNI